ncbi:hypothetical protein ACP4OV_007846 [Aristida adscensionis]
MAPRLARRHRVSLLAAVALVLAAFAAAPLAAGSAAGDKARAAKAAAAKAAAAGGGVSIDEACAKTPHPEPCKKVLGELPDAKAAATPRALAEVAIRASAKLGDKVGTYANEQLDEAKDNDLWQCLDECSQDIEEAISHLDDSEGKIDDAKFNTVHLFLDTAEKDSWSCDATCQETPESPTKTELLDKNRQFEEFMAITNSLIKQATGGRGPTPLSVPAP